MPKFEWDDRFLIGIPRCDEQHQRLVSLLNKAYDAFTDTADDQDVAWLLNELVDYATYHFISEEQWMVASKFPDFEMHKSAHDAFSNQVAMMYKKYRNGDTTLLADIFLFLNDWLVTHILKVDAEFGQFMVRQSNILSKRDPH